ncbi:9560_t:CDS:2 [Entrophospora sp. SA101]|nr:9560_t:CDS:2 [Entrophospora sp. SA101]
MTNDGATILKHMALVVLSAAQDVEAGDGTTSVVYFLKILGIHPTTIAEVFQRAATKSSEFLTEMSTQIDFLLAPIAVDSVLRVIDSVTATNVDLRDIRIVKKVGGTIDDTELVDGLVLTQNVVKDSGGPSRIEKAKIGLIQFQLSPPKPDMENQIVVNDYILMDKILKEERQYLLNMCKKIKKTGCNVLLIQKSIIRDAVNDLSLHFLSKLKILVVKDIERDEVEFICKSTGCKPIADIESFTEDKLGYAELVDEVQTSGARVVKITGVKHNGKTVSILSRGANSLVLEEAGRSLHDALCVIRCLVKKNALIAGGGAPEIEVSQSLSDYAKSLKGMEAHCFEAFATALEVIPLTLAEMQLRNRHALGEKTAGINVRKPLLVSTSAIELASETVKMILKIDDLVQTH